MQEAYARFLKNHQELHKDGLEMFLMFIDLQVTVNMDMTTISKWISFRKMNGRNSVSFYTCTSKDARLQMKIYTLINAGYSDAALARWAFRRKFNPAFISNFFSI